MVTKVFRGLVSQNFSNYLPLFQSRIKSPGHNSQLSPASRTGYKLPTVLILEKLIG